MGRSTLYKFVEEKMGDDLHFYLEACRSDQMTLEQIAEDLFLISGVSVGKSTVHDWVIKEGIN
jgi:hypothetical protein